MNMFNLIVPIKQGGFQLVVRSPKTSTKLITITGQLSHLKKMHKKLPQKFFPSSQKQDFEQQRNIELKKTHTQQKATNFYPANINAAPLPHVRACWSPFLSCQIQKLTETVNLEHQFCVCDMSSMPDPDLKAGLFISPWCPAAQNER